MDTWLMDIYYTPRTNTWRDQLSPSRHSEYVLPTNNPRIKIYFSSHTDIRKLESYGLRNIYSFFPDGDNEQEEIKDFISTQRDKNKKRLFSQWTLITTLIEKMLEIKLMLIKQLINPIRFWFRFHKRFNLIFFFIVNYRSYCFFFYFF
ncbi:hypothetical protein MGF_5456 [Mycoplasmoides gallisepticum str. F]|uniref:hypothetical protein n=1 Tax=Mycoplasmoides gallisepticum TaxID=2096 RepID=UPI0001C39A37|nr:hypothetical protein MGF_5456 [Mycoplasmoides gallisepticum str. F]